MNLTDISKAFWINPNHTHFRCTYNHPDFGPVPLDVIEGDGGDLSTEAWNLKDLLDIKEYEDRDMTDDYLAEIDSLKQYLSSTDYMCLKYMDGELTEEEYTSVKNQRHQARVRINYLEELLDSNS